MAMRVDDGLALHAAVTGHAQQLGRMVKVADVADVGRGVDLAGSHQPKGLDDVPRTAARGAGDVDLLVVHEALVDPDDLLARLEAGEEVQHAVARQQVLDLLHQCPVGRGDDEVVRSGAVADLLHGRGQVLRRGVDGHELNASSGGALPERGVDPGQALIAARGGDDHARARGDSQVHVDPAHGADADDDGHTAGLQAGRGRARPCAIGLRKMHVVGV